MSMLANTVHGLPRNTTGNCTLLAYGPALTYASTVRCTGKKSHEKELERVQRRALRKVIAALRTMPIEAVEIEASIPPIHLHLDQCARRAALGLNKRSTRNPVIQRLDNTWRSGRNPRNPNT